MAFARGTWTGRAMSAAIAAQAQTQIAPAPAPRSEAAKKAADAAQKVLVSPALPPNTQNSSS